MISLGREPQVANVFYDPSPGGATDTIIGSIPSIASPLLIFPGSKGGIYPAPTRHIATSSVGAAYMPPALFF